LRRHQNREENPYPQLRKFPFTWEHDAHLSYKRAMSMQHAFGGTPEFQDKYARLLFRDRP
jgi:hypothetical protein